MKEIVNYISSEMRIENKSLIEKDIILHKLLSYLAGIEYFRDNFVFKGGTCLTKCYYGYFRFSEDLDFSYRKQDNFEGLSQKEIRKYLSNEINKLLQLIEKFTKENKIDFVKEKSNKKYVEIGGSNKFVTFKLWYKSEILDVEQFIKVQINFVELFHYSFKKKKASSLIKGINLRDLQFLYPEESKYLLEDPNIYCYNIKEILIEKFRAVLTRKGIKARDFIDIFLILENEKIELKKIRSKIIDKINFMLRYDKYIQNLKEFKIEKLVIGQEQKLMLKPIDKKYNEKLKDLIKFLDELSDEFS
ncbi:nucleotidyl transferase AbiEii/AbiGii toxin family protein [Candidatus Woesearchaeota archaeon]|nr:nucleotidyl transferase AbiEii/AbiGii toxin family protein [Candidatus Woesearchaeota archaeon]